MSGFECGCSIDGLRWTERWCCEEEEEEKEEEEERDATQQNNKNNNKHNQQQEGRRDNVFYQHGITYSHRPTDRHLVSASQRHLRWIW